MKKVRIILSTGFLILALTACAGNQISSVTQTVGQESVEIVQTTSNNTNATATEVDSTPAASVVFGLNMS